MTATTVTIPSDSDYGQKPWAARILGRDPKTGYEREFLGSSTVATCGLFEASERKSKRTWYLVLRDEGAGLIRLEVGEETRALVLDTIGVGAVDQIVPYKDSDGDWRVRRADGTIALRNSRDELIAERARLIARIAEIDREIGQ